MSKKYKDLSPFAEWLVKFVEERDTTLTAISNEAGLSAGTLRHLVIDPKRKPTIETCLRLSAISGRSMDELLALAGQIAGQAIDPYHPDRLKLMRIFDTLPPEGRTSLLKIAIAVMNAFENALHLGEGLVASTQDMQHEK